MAGEAREVLTADLYLLSLYGIDDLSTRLNLTQLFSMFTKVRIWDIIVLACYVDDCTQGFRSTYNFTVAVLIHRLYPDTLQLYRFATSMDPSIRISKDQYPQTPGDMYKVPYREAIGLLNLSLYTMSRNRSLRSRKMGITTHEQHKSNLLPYR